MDPKAFLFYLFAAVTVFAALRVVTARNPVHSALFLVLAFLLPLFQEKLLPDN